MTASVLVIADDFTGANAAAAGFARAGMRAVTLGGEQRAAAIRDFAQVFDVLVVSTDSRHGEPGPAARRVTELVETGWPVRLVCNRVDTTLRGHLAVTTRAMLDAVARLGGRRAVALCAPAHPEAGRQTVDGIQLLHGRRLELTELARDALNPMRTSDVAEIVAAPTGLRATKIPLRAVTGDPDRLTERIRAAVPHTDVLIADAISTEHLTLAAEAVARSATDVTWIAVDPGPGALALAVALGLDRRAERPRPPILVVSGSATALTRRQLQRLVGDVPAVVVRAGPGAAGGRLDRARLVAETERAFDEHPEVVVVATAIDDAEVGPLEPADAARLPHDLAAAMHEVLAHREVAGLFCGGGDLTAAMLAAMGAAGLEVEREIVPLAVAGVVVGGSWDALPILTKGGLVGDAGTIVTCVAHLRSRAQAARRSVPVGAGPARHHTLTGKDTA